MPKIFFHCNPVLNTPCSKSACATYGHGSCKLTSNPAFTDTPDKIVMVVEMDEKDAAEILKGAPKDVIQ